jgi:phospholipid/cholesterol/gamma-HCH transport system substrate-binding protein
VIGRIAAFAAVAIAILAVVVIVMSGGSSYEVKAIFQNASQVVKGDQVEVAGNSVGSVSDLQLTPNNQAELTLSINDSHFQPLHQGTEATVRLTSLSGIANRYVDLRLPSGSTPSIPSGGVIGTQNTTSAVDLDELFNTLDQPTLKGLQNVLQGSASQYAGRGQQIQRALQYLNPAIVSSSVLFSEINRDTGKFTNFIVKSGNLLSDLATRSTDLSGLVQHLATTTEALAAQQTALGQSIQRLPGFMRLANTTFVNLRSALDDLTPLVNVSKPVAPKLQKFLVQLKPLADNAVPTVHDLAHLICSAPSGTCTPNRPGQNDLIELTKLGVPLAAATCGTGPGATNCLGHMFANGKLRSAAFPQSTTSLNNSTPELATARPYAVDLTGWFEGYTHPGGIDANGGYSRIAPVVGLQSAAGGVLNFIPSGVTGFLQQFLGTGAPGGNPLLTTGQGDRCPGSVERGAIYYPALSSYWPSGFPCNPNQVPTGS